MSISPCFRFPICCCFRLLWPISYLIVIPFPSSILSHWDSLNDMALWPQNSSQSKKRKYTILGPLPASINLLTVQGCHRLCSASYVRFQSSGALASITTRSWGLSHMLYPVSKPLRVLEALNWQVTLLGELPSLIISRQLLLAILDSRAWLLLLRYELVEILMSSWPIRHIPWHIMQRLGTAAITTAPVLRVTWIRAAVRSTPLPSPSPGAKHYGLYLVSIPLWRNIPMDLQSFPRLRSSIGEQDRTINTLDNISQCYLILETHTTQIPMAVSCLWTWKVRSRRMRIPCSPNPSHRPSLAFPVFRSSISLSSGSSSLQDRQRFDSDN